MRKPDLLLGLTESQLHSLAEGMLATPHQERLSELLARNRAGALIPSEIEEMDRLLEQLDDLNILKARARYTLQQTPALPA